jgi:hypothetical protein
VEFLRNLHEAQSKVEFHVDSFLQMVALLGTFRSICDGMDDGNQAKKGNVIQMSNLPLKHEKGGPV